jgi:lysophospholipase L1-like esterase
VPVKENCVVKRSSNRFWAIGDSLTSGAFWCKKKLCRSPYAKTLGGLLNMTYELSGFPGATAGGVLHNVRAILNGRKEEFPKVDFCLVMAGTNDILQGRNNITFTLGNIREIHSLCRERLGAPTVALLMPPVYPAYGPKAPANMYGYCNEYEKAVGSRETHRRGLNRAIAALDANELGGCGVFEWTTSVLPPPTGPVDKYWTDCVHFNAAGSEVVAHKIREHLQQARGL